jgi:DNA replication and repair protein RecF
MGLSQRAGVELRFLELVDVRLFRSAALELKGAASTVLSGPNGAGKTTVLEAIAYLGSQRSFRSASREAMVRVGAQRAVARAELDHGPRAVLVESELRAGGGAQTSVNRRRVQGRRELADALPVTVFSPEDLALVQGPPARRRELVDTALSLVDRRAAADLDELDRVLRQRAALLRQAGGTLTSAVASTLDVWDERLMVSGEAVARARQHLLRDAAPWVQCAYASLAGHSGGADLVELDYVPGWEGELATALAASRAADVRRQVSLVGPHRDEVLLRINGREARVRASQGEQRSLALALRLGLHRWVGERRGTTPLLLLDDVFSELDPDRSRALARHLPSGQTLLTTASALPEGIEVDQVIDVRSLGRRE